MFRRPLRFPLLTPRIQIIPDFRIVSEQQESWQLYTDTQTACRCLVFSVIPAVTVTCAGTCSHSHTFMSVERMLKQIRVLSTLLQQQPEVFVG